MPNGQVGVFTDTVDDGQILSLLSLGQEKFLAGSHQNACLKTFDLRRTGHRPYSYLGDRDRRGHAIPSANKKGHRSNGINSTPPQRKDYNIFLAIPMNPRLRTFWDWQPNGRQPGRLKPERYRGSVYSLSSPSLASPTVYAGIENHVLQLDFAASDDLLKRQRSWYQQDLGIDVGNPTDMVSLAAYDRPLTFEDQTPIKLRNQLAFGQEWTGGSEDGWDDRWRIPVMEKWRSDRA